MSTKTTFKRVALVAVAALGLGVLSTAPSNAALANDSVVTLIKATLNTSTTTLAARVGQEISFNVTGTTAATTAAAKALPTLTMAASLTSQPAGSTEYATIAHIIAGFSNGTAALSNQGAGLAIAAARGSTNATAEAVADLTDTGGPAKVATISYSADDVTAAAYAKQDATTALATVSFTPKVAGVYTMVVWNESDRLHGSPSGADTTAIATSEAALSGSDSYQTFTINVVSAISTVAISAINSTAAVDTAQISDGTLLKVTLKDAAGNIAIPATGESVTLTPSSTTAQFAKVNGSAVISAAGAAYSLSAASFGNSGTAWVNMINTVAEAVTVVASYSGSASASVTATFRTVGDPGADSAALPYGTSGFKAVTSAAGANATTDFPIGSVTGYFYITGTYSSTTASYKGITVTDLTGVITGVDGTVAYTNDLAYDAAATVGDDSVTTDVDGAILSVAFTTTAETASIFTAVAIDGTNPRTQTVSSKANTAGTATATPAVVNAVAGATNSITVNLKDYFSRAYANQTLTGVVTGRNPTTVAKTALTDALGNATFTLTDANTTSVIASDVLTVTGGSNSPTVTVLYGAANAPSTITLTSTGDTDVIAGTTKTDIAAGYAGATGKYATASAVVKNSAGSAVAGVAVTFTVTGLVGAEVHTTKATVYTDTTGTAVSYISSYAAGKATVTATAGTATASDDIYFAQNTPEEARTIAISAVGGLVTATVKDRYGNVVKDVDVNATRTGTGYFGAGASTATGKTDKNGVVEFNFVGSGTVTVAFTSATYGQSYAAAGYDYDAVNGTAITASVAGTSATNQKGLGAALAPAGINSASLAVEGANLAADNSQAAADAAAEATDAANAATDAANAAAEAADAATAAAQDAADAVAALSTQVSEMINALKKQITALTNLVIKIQKKVKA